MALGLDGRLGKRLGGRLGLVKSFVMGCVVEEERERQGDMEIRRGLGH